MAGGGQGGAGAVSGGAVVEGPAAGAEHSKGGSLLASHPWLVAIPLVLMLPMLLPLAVVIGMVAGVPAVLLYAWMNGGARGGAVAAAAAPDAPTPAPARSAAAEEATKTTTTTNRKDAELADMPPPAPLPGAGAAAKQQQTAAAAKVAPAPAAATAAAAPAPAPDPKAAPSAAPKPAAPTTKVETITTKVVTPVVVDAAAAAAAASAAPTPAAASAPAAANSAAAVPAPPAPASASAAPAVLTGSAAILARMRSQKQQRQQQDASQQTKPRLVVTYASQTGTAQEIARNVAAEALERANKLGDACPYLPPAKGAALSFNQLGWQRVGAGETPLLVVVASSTGDGEPPDNSAIAYVAMRKGGQDLGGRLKGVRATVLGLGDSNYTRYMAVPRAIRGRMADLGAETFYAGCDADEVDGLETSVDPWVEGLWPALEAAGRAWIAERGGGGGGETKEGRAAEVKEAAAAAATTAVAAAAAALSPAPPTAAPSPAPSSAKTDGTVGDMPTGVPALAPTRIRIVFEGLAEEVVAAARARDAAASRGESGENSSSANSAAAAAPTADSPAYVRVSGAKLMTAEWSDRRVVRVTLDVAGTALGGGKEGGGGFGPGDAVGLLPRNDPALVDGVLAALGLDGDAVFDVAPAETEGEQQQDDEQQQNEALAPHLGAPCTLRAAFSRALDLTTPARKSLLRLLAEHASDAAERRHLLRLCGRDGRAAYSEEIVKGRPTLLDLLSRFPSAARAVPPAALVDALPPLAPRMYSVASSPLEQPGSLDFAFSAVTVEQTLYPGPVADGAAAAEGGAASGAGATREGVATGWLQRLLLPAPASASDASVVYVPAFLRRAVDFRPPEDLATPVVMIGPGTGVAPFRGFLQHRRAQAAAAAAGEGGGSGNGSGDVGPAWLYFGCRRRDEDCLFAEDWEAFVADGTLQRLRLAFSRDPAAAKAAVAAAANGGGAPKMYVQHLMAEDAEELGELVVGRGARVYVCGDGAQMAKDVHACLARVVARALARRNKGEGGLSAAAADEDESGEGAAELAAMAKAGRYVRDIWC